MPRLRHPRFLSLVMQGSVLLAVFLWSCPGSVILAVSLRSYKVLSSTLSVVSLIHITHRFYQLTVYLYLMRGNSGLWVLCYEKMLIFSIFLVCHYLLQFEKCNFTMPNRNRGVVMVAVVQYWRNVVKEVDILMRKRKKEYADTYTKREPA